MDVCVMLLISYGIFNAQVFFSQTFVIYVIHLKPKRTFTTCTESSKIIIYTYVPLYDAPLDFYRFLK
jgi:hypothetical protein